MPSPFIAGSETKRPPFFERPFLSFNTANMDLLFRGRVDADHLSRRSPPLTLDY